MRLQISKDFTLAEMLKSGTAISRGYDEQLYPTIEVVKNLEKLVTTILQPLRDAVGAPIIINSAYRCYRLNKFVGGSDTSQHVTGQAADIECGIGNVELYNTILKLNLPFDQLINEFNFSWIHVSVADNPRGQILKAIKENGKTKYIKP